MRKTERYAVKCKSVWRHCPPHPFHYVTTPLAASPFTHLPLHSIFKHICGLGMVARPRLDLSGRVSEAHISPVRTLRKSLEGSAWKSTLLCCENLTQIKPTFFSTICLSSQITFVIVFNVAFHRIFISFVALSKLHRHVSIRQYGLIV